MQNITKHLTINLTIESIQIVLAVPVSASILFLTSSLLIVQLRPKLLAPQEFCNVFLKIFPMFAALINLDIIKHAPVLFSSFWYTFKYKIHF